MVYGMEDYFLGVLGRNCNQVENKAFSRTMWLFWSLGADDADINSRVPGVIQFWPGTELHDDLPQKRTYENQGDVLQSPFPGSSITFQA